MKFDICFLELHQCFFIPSFLLFPWFASLDPTHSFGAFSKIMFVSFHFIPNYHSFLTFQTCHRRFLCKKYVLALLVLLQQFEYFPTIPKSYVSGRLVHPIELKQISILLLIQGIKKPYVLLSLLLLHCFYRCFPVFLLSVFLFSCFPSSLSFIVDAKFDEDIHAGSVLCVCLIVYLH